MPERFSARILKSGRSPRLEGRGRPIRRDAALVRGLRKDQRVREGIKATGGGADQTRTRSD